MSDMYNWITAPNMNPLAGKCSHECSYCYVEEMKRFPASAAKYSGLPRLDGKVLSKNIKKPGLRFLCSCNDLFANDVPQNLLLRIIDWAAEQESTTWAIQTKNPKHPTFMFLIKHKPANFLLGATIESNRDYPEISKAPPQSERFVKGLDYITIEPIMDFDSGVFTQLLRHANPKFINIGADSGGNNLPEPDANKIYGLILNLKHHGVEVRIKSNLARIAPGLVDKDGLK